MSIKSILYAAGLAMVSAVSALADNIMIHDPYARASTAMSTSGAAFMVIMNHSDIDDRLIGIHSDIAQRAELHTHRENDSGVMQMIHVEEGFPLPAHGKIEMMRGGRHVMFLGLNAPLEQGQIVNVTLEFEQAGAIEVDVPVDLTRKPDHSHMQHNH